MSNVIAPPSGIVLPNGQQITAEIQHDARSEEEYVDNTTPEEKARQLPEPRGWKILCALPEVSDKVEGSDVIVRPDQYRKQDEIATVVLFVVKVGPTAYKDENKFGPNAEPWCKEGDFIITRTYSGTRFKIWGREFRLIDDDMVEAVVQDPRGLSRHHV
ncbi:MAG TPA: hypothetical protein PLQ34_07865 [Ferrovaceae bacterium]|jgi:co-chaperonin GroES (HSP10)|nr:hypothetical protein [Ferrovaceae bacterium]